MAEMSPMMQQYVDTKKEYPDCLLFWRLGDFYETFFDDALTASRELDIVLTGRDCGLDERAPMCGVPYHALDGYLTKLLNKGYKVAICEQVEDPKEAKGLVKREVTRVVTPGTTMDPQALDAERNNYIMAVVYMNDCFGLAVSDITTGQFLVTEKESRRALADELYKYNPSEILYNENVILSGFDFEPYLKSHRAALETVDDTLFRGSIYEELILKQFRTASLMSLGLTEFPIGTMAAGALISYLLETQKGNLSQINHMTICRDSQFMLLDHASRRNLELTETMRDKERKGSLLWVLDKTRTAMGARYLRNMIEQPLLKPQDIMYRQDFVAEMTDKTIDREELREYLSPIYDFERLMSRISFGTANPRDLYAFMVSLKTLPYVRTMLSRFESRLAHDLYEMLDPLEDLCEMIEKGIVDDPPMAMKDGGIIRDGYNSEVDRLREAKDRGKEWIAAIETKERERTGIRTLKVKFNKVFGYFIEVTRSNLDLVPEDYMRKQTLTNAERFIIPELKELEDTVLGAQDRLYVLEYELFSEIRGKIAGQIERVQKTAHAVSVCDALCSLAYVAQRENYCRPAITNDGSIMIKDGRHPVVEKMTKPDTFIPNDTYLDIQDQRINIITGPNMAGKSTYMRQVALIVLMAQIGSFVPASGARIGVVDRIFTRVGASDDLASGQSTFMVEMTEVANIVRNATAHSLLILDEIGRGTSTYDGLSIAWAVVEYISNTKKLGAKTLFATHYHELTELEGKIDGVHNYCIAVKEQGDDIVFLRKVVKGGADKSYGIQVARLAGVPAEIIGRAKEIVETLSDTDVTQQVQLLMEHAVSEGNGSPDEVEDEDPGQISFFDTVPEEDILRELESIDLDNLRPVEVVRLVEQLQNRLRNRWRNDAY